METAGSVETCCGECSTYRGFISLGFVAKGSSCSQIEMKSSAPAPKDKNLLKVLRDLKRVELSSMPGSRSSPGKYAVYHDTKLPFYWLVFGVCVEGNIQAPFTPAAVMIGDRSKSPLSNHKALLQHLISATVRKPVHFLSA